MSDDCPNCAALRAELAHANDVLSSYRGTYTREKERAERAEERVRELEKQIADKP